MIRSCGGGLDRNRRAGGRHGTAGAADPARMVEHL